MRHGRPCGVGTVGPSSVPWSDGDGWMPGGAAGVGLEESGWAWGSGLSLLQGPSGSVVGGDGGVCCCPSLPSGGAVAAWRWDVMVGVAWVYARRKRRFRSVSLPEPSTLTRYWSWPGDSMTTPDLSHFVGWGPCWFWRKTLSPMDRGRSGREWSFRLSLVREIRVLRASSLAAHAWRHSGRMLGFEYFSRRLTNARESRRGRPKMICAGERLQSGSGVFRSWSMARRKRLWSRLPVGPVFDVRSRLAVLTATSALPLDCGKLTEEIRCRTPQSRRKSSVCFDVNSGPPSLVSSSGTPNVPKKGRRWRTSPAEPPRVVPAVELKTSTQPERRSPTTR